MSPGIMMEAPSHKRSFEDLETNPQTLLTPSYVRYADALAGAKYFLDPLAASSSAAQKRKIQLLRKKRKRGENNSGEADRNLLKLKKVHLDGFTVEGVWGQAQRVLSASATNLQDKIHLRKLTATSDQEDTLNKSPRAHQFDDQGFEVDSNDFSSVESSESFHSGEAYDDNAGKSGEDKESLGRGETSYLDDAAEDDDDEEREGGKEGDSEGISDLEDEEIHSSTKNFVKDKHGLNDGFFDIDDFNKESDFLEQDPTIESREDSDEDSIDYFTNPMEQQHAKLPNSDQRNGKSLQSESSLHESDDDESGPKFQDADLDAPWSDDDDDADTADPADFADDVEDSGFDNANDIRYEDFFDPPSKPLQKTRRLRALPKTQPQNVTSNISGNEIQRTIESVKRDIFEDDFSDANVTPNEDMDEDVSGQRNLSTHERRRMLLAKQIRELEAAAVSKRRWQMSGEISAQARPEDALLEEDLDFERTGKPVPVITAEVSTSIEDMIKQRILNRQFDEVIKRHGNSGSNLGQDNTRRGLIELSDQKDPQSLAESYEQAYLAENDPNAKDARSETLKAQHTEIQQLWNDVCGKLDALTSWRYKPKPAGVEVSIITDAPKVLMEDARPSGVEGVRSDQGGLAPQELYHVGDKERPEGMVMTKGGGVFAKEELSREQKLRRRRREKERTKKRSAETYVKPSTVKPDAVPTKRKDDQTEVLKQLKASGVKVIGKGGQLQDVDGQKVSERKSGNASALKL